MVHVLGPRWKCQLMLRWQTSRGQAWYLRFGTHSNLTYWTEESTEWAWHHMLQTSPSQGRTEESWDDIPQDTWSRQHPQSQVNLAYTPKSQILSGWCIFPLDSKMNQCWSAEEKTSKWLKEPGQELKVNSFDGFKRGMSRLLKRWCLKIEQRARHGRN